MPKKTSKKDVPAVSVTPSKLSKNSFLAGLAKRSGVTIIPVSELAPTNVKYTDTGSYSLNALISGSLFGGIPSDTIVGIAGEQATGKTYVCLSICEHFLKTNEDGVVFYFDTEHAIKPHMIADRNLPEDRFIINKVNTLEQFRMEAVRLIDGYMEEPEEKRPPMLFVLDSLGNISTVKEILEAGEDVDKQAKDMTKAQLVRSVFRVLAIKLGEANVPLLVTNHVGVKIGGFTRPGMPPPKEMSGGEGLKYAASTIIFLSKSKLYNKITKEFTGNDLTGTLYKSRNTIENMKAQTRLDYQTGMDRYFGLFDLAKKFGIVENSGNGFKFNVGENRKQFFTKDIEGDPEKGLRGTPELFFTQDVLNALEEKVVQGFRYGKGAGAANAMLDNFELLSDGGDEAPVEE